MSVQNAQQVDKNIDWVTKIKNVEKLYAQFVEKCQNGYYRKVGVSWNGKQAKFNQSTLDNYNNKGLRTKTDHSSWFTSEECDKWLKNNKITNNK